MISPELAKLQTEWLDIQWALDQGAIATKTEAEKARNRQIAIEREMDGQCGDRTP